MLATHNCNRLAASKAFLYAYMHTYNSMSHKNINVSVEVYEKLASLKLPGESFTKLLSRIVSGEEKSAGLREFFGKWNVSDAQMREVNKNLRELGRSSRRLQ